VYAEATANIATRAHITAKPVGVMSWLLEPIRPGQRILDPFAGSGSTGVAALRREIQFVGFELDPEIHAVAVKRLEREANRHPLFEGLGGSASRSASPSASLFP
jgi:site-specific DNA-methyltransferase (adenine-specific)